MGRHGEDPRRVQPQVRGGRPREDCEGDEGADQRDCGHPRRQAAAHLLRARAVRRQEGVGVPAGGEDCSPGGAAAAGRRPPVACDLQDPETFALLLLRAPGPANDPRYDRLDPSVGLDLNLADRCVIEYPQIVVARPGDVDRRFRLAPNPVQLFFADDQSTSAGGQGEMRRV